MHGAQPEWAEAEDAFLATIGEVSDLGFAARVTSDQRARRFNSLRVLDPHALDQATWEGVLREQTPLFHAVRMPLTVQLAAPHGAHDLPGRWRRVGATFVHVATDLTDFRDISPRTVALRRLETSADIDLFLTTMMPARVPAHLRDSVRPMIEAAIRRSLARPGVAAMLACDGERVVGQVVCATAPGGQAVSNLTVRPEHRGQGYMKAIYAALAERFEGRLYGQIIDGVATLAYRERFPSTRRLATTRTYQPDADPYAEAPALDAA